MGFGVLLGDLTGDLDLDLGGLVLACSAFKIAVWDRVTLELGARLRRT